MRWRRSIALPVDAGEVDRRGCQWHRRCPRAAARPSQDRRRWRALRLPSASGPCREVVGASEASTTPAGMVRRSVVGARSRLCEVGRAVRGRCGRLCVRRPAPASASARHRVARRVWRWSPARESVKLATPSPPKLSAPLLVKSCSVPATSPVKRDGLVLRRLQHRGDEAAGRAGKIGRALDAALRATIRRRGPPCRQGRTRARASGAQSQSHRAGGRRRHRCDIALRCRSRVRRGEGRPTETASRRRPMSGAASSSSSMARRGWRSTSTVRTAMVRISSSPANSAVGVHSMRASRARSQTPSSSTSAMSASVAASSGSPLRPERRSVPNGPTLRPSICDRMKARPPSLVIQKRSATALATSTGHRDHQPEGDAQPERVFALRLARSIRRPVRWKYRPGSRRRLSALFSGTAISARSGPKAV